MSNFLATNLFSSVFPLAEWVAHWMTRYEIFHVIHRLVAGGRRCYSYILLYFRHIFTFSHPHQAKFAFFDNNKLCGNRAILNKKLCYRLYDFITSYLSHPEDHLFSRVNEMLLRIKSWRLRIIYGKVLIQPFIMRL